MAAHTMAAATTTASSPTVGGRPGIGFCLLNGFTTDFQGRIPTTLDDKDLINSTTQNDISYNCNFDIIGVDPFGRGRLNDAGNCYVYSLLMMAKVTPGLSYTWDRHYQTRSVIITKSSDGTRWNVTCVNNANVPTGSPSAPVEDSPNAPGTDKTVTPSKTNVLYFFDNPGMSMGLYSACKKYDYAYFEADFTYTLTGALGTQTVANTIHVGQVVKAQRTNVTGTVTSDWTPLQNTVSTTEIPSCRFDDDSKIRAIVGGTLPIVFDTNINNTY
jgi:hypothetical protein